MKSSQPVFTCDHTGCRSMCTLDPRDAVDAESHVVKRGWTVQIVNGQITHLCPAHKDKTTAAPNLG